MNSDEEIEILDESIDLIESRQREMRKHYNFIGPGATALFNGYETLVGAIIHLRQRRSRLELNRILTKEQPDG